jgi:hypothetical protein
MQKCCNAPPFHPGGAQRWTSSLNGVSASVKWGSSKDRLDPINQVREICLNLPAPSLSAARLFNATAAAGVALLLKLAE